MNKTHRLLRYRFCTLYILYYLRKDYSAFFKKLQSNQTNPALHIFFCLLTKYSRFVNIIFTNPSAWAGYDTRSIFKQSLTGLNSEFPSPRLVASPRT